MRSAYRRPRGQRGDRRLERSRRVGELAALRESQTENIEGVRAMIVRDSGVEGRAEVVDALVARGQLEVLGPGLVLRVHRLHEAQLAQVRVHVGQLVRADAEFQGLGQRAVRAVAVHGP